MVLSVRAKIAAFRAEAGILASRAPAARLGARTAGPCRGHGAGGISASDATALSIATAVAIVTAIAACLPPARRAASLDPLAGLRAE